MSQPSFIRGPTPLAPYCTLAVGGTADYLATVQDAAEVLDALEWAHAAGVDMTILGGGSNCLVADAGLRGLVLQYSEGSRRILQQGQSDCLVRIGAGHDWDALVAWAVAEGLCGIECLSGIPGRVGAAPMQNIGAYGQALAGVLEAVSVVDLGSGRFERIEAGDLGLSYRNSHLKTQWRGRFLVTDVELRLRRGEPAPARYGQLEEALAAHGGTADLRSIREQVLALRRRKSMVYDPEDANHRSAGSFFLNPRIDDDDISGLEARLEALGVSPESLPRYPDGDRWKVPAAWLIEKAGFEKGLVRGPVGLSTNHSLALINRGEAKATDLVALAREIHQGVRERLGVALWPEPIFLGFEQSAAELLEGT